MKARKIRRVAAGRDWWRWRHQLVWLGWHLVRLLVDWKSSVVLPIYKGKGDPMECGSFFLEELNWWNIPSVHWRWWSGVRNGIQPVKNWVVDAGMIIGLGRGADLHMAQVANATHYILLHKSRLVLPSWFYLSGVNSPGLSRTESREP